MRYGEKGIVILIVAICVCGFGGFVFNVTDEAVAKSNFDYVTDVAGSFTGSNGDISVDYNPYTNLTGYSIYDPTSNEQTGNVIPGITYKQTGANGYWIPENKNDTTSATLQLTNNKSTTSSSSGTATMVKTLNGTSTTKTLTIAKEYGLDNAEVKTQINVGGVMHTRVVGVPLTEILTQYGTFTTNKVIMTVQSPSNNYPGFIANADMDISMIDTSIGRYVQSLVTYSDISYTITIDPLNQTVVMNGKTYASQNITFVWGTSSNTVSTINMIVGATVINRYMDPAYGVQPQSGTISNTQIVMTTAYAKHVEFDINVPSASSVGTARQQAASGVVTLMATDNTVSSFLYQIYNTETDRLMWINGTGVLFGSDSYGPSFGVKIVWDYNNPGVFTVTGYNSASGQNTTVATNFGSGSEMKSGNVTVNAVGDNSANNTVVTITSKPTAGSGSTDATSVTQTGTGTLTKNMQHTTSQTVTVETTYNTTYWNNTQLNNSSVQYNGNTMLAMMFKRPTTNLYNSFDMSLKHADNSVSPITVNINYTGSGWVVNGTEYGAWQGILLTFRVIDGGLTLEIQPVSSFTSFINYTLVDRIYTQDTYGSLTGIKTIQYMKFANTDTVTYMWHEVVATSVFLAGGGLYIQDGVFNLKSSFPNDMLVAFKVMSAAHVGTGISIYPTNGVPTTWNVNSAGTGWVIDGKTYKFSDVTFYYADANLPPVTIGGNIYEGLYMDGQEYAKGHLYYKAGTFGTLTDLGESTNNWNIRLNGTWAMSTAYYVGENTGDVQTKFSNIGTWGWDSTQLILVFIGVLIIGMSLVAWKFDADITDWIVVICAGAISFILLG